MRCIYENFWKNIRKYWKIKTYYDSYLSQLVANIFSPKLISSRSSSYIFLYKYKHVRTCYSSLLSSPHLKTHYLFTSFPSKFTYTSNMSVYKYGYTAICFFYLSYLTNFIVLVIYFVKCKNYINFYKISKK